ncbi:MAG: nucleotidyltransferase substrate binding protein [Leptospiraceae bacterium]|nr:nucleotidyltransferase substrate binding protein [Leptospiraceae bacterium]
MIDYNKLKKSIKRLEEQYQNYISIKEDEGTTLLIKEAVKESVIQRFETCYDTVWKHLKKYLEEELGLPDVPNSPKPIFRLANENNFNLDIEKWFEYGQARIDTSHDYSEEKASIAIEKIQFFLNDTIILYQKVTKEKWA